MKKLMIAAALVCAAAMSQAAAITWSTGKIYMVDADGAWTGDTAYSKNTMISAFTATAYLYDATGNTLLGSGTVTGTGAEIFTKKASSISAKDFVDAGGNVVTVDNKASYMVQLVMSGDFGNGGTQDFLATDKQLFTVGDTGDASVAFDTLPKVIDTTVGNVQWTAAPEPTSGLLLLLGVGALALRRRRA